MIKTNINNFVNSKVIFRNESLFSKDLLKFNLELQNSITNKNVLVIGGAGSIGSSYIKAILQFNIKSLVVIDVNENALTELVRDLRSSLDYNIPELFITYPIDFGNKIFEKIFEKYGPFEIISNFAAHKHVRTEKDVFSIEAMIENNFFKAKKLLDLLKKHPPEHFFCVSTDKAANPVNIMGATKKLMEELILSYSSFFPVKTARFANVAFSNGSLLLGFINRLINNQPLSCPSDIRRFFVSSQESGHLCLIASILGESGDVFFPKLDEKKDMISFEKITKDLLNYLGLEIDICKTEHEAKKKSKSLSYDSKKIPVFFFESNTTGEKKFEEFYSSKEVLDLKTYHKLGVIKNSNQSDFNKIDMINKDLKSLFFRKNFNKNEIVSILKKYLSNFNHIETGNYLDQKM